MSKVICEKSLPPNVKGRCRGNVEIKIHELRWRSTTKAFGAVEAKIIWWGESFQSGAVLKFDSRKNFVLETRTIKYKILTNAKLFQEYIKTCEPIEIKFTSAISNIQIGTSFVALPPKVINFFATDNHCQTLYHKSIHHIFSPKNCNLGDIAISIEITNFEKESPRMVAPIVLNSQPKIEQNDEKQSQKPQSANEKCNQTKNNDSIRNKINPLLLCEQIKLTNRSLDKSKNPTRSTTFDYLTGRAMTKEQEIKALNEIKESSPTGSFVEALSENIFKQTNFQEDNFISKIDSIKINIIHFALTKAGIREISIKNINEGRHINVATFVVECKLNTSFKKDRNENYKFDFDVVRVFSNSITDFTSKIEFNKEAIRRMYIPKTDISSRNIKFLVWFREFGTKQSHLLGKTYIQIKDILQSDNLSCTRKCFVKSLSGDILVGTLYIKLELGTRGVHFGSDFFDAIYCNKENLADSDIICIDSDDNIPTNLMQKQYTEPSSNHRQPIKSYCCCCVNAKQNICPKGCNHDKQEQTNSSKSSEAVSAATENRQDRPSSSRNAIDNFQDNGLVNVGNLNRMVSESNLLYGLIYIGSIFHVKKPQIDVDTFMVCRAFWTEDVTSTNMCENNIFNFLEIFPIICNARFFERTQNQFLELEMWQKQRENPEQMIGVSALPLHQFHVAFRDPVVMNHLSRVKLPVISIDGWTSIVSPLTSSPVAKLQVLLAIGTEEQLEYLKASRGLSQGCLSEEDILKNKLPVPRMIATPSISNAETQTSFISTQNDAEIQTSFMDGEPIQNPAERQAALAEMLNNFIDNLASRLPERSNTNEHIPQSTTPQNVQIRRTSDLLDALQRALMCPPMVETGDNMSSTPVDLQQKANSNTCVAQPIVPQFQVMIDIENALHISKIFIRVNKKCGKQRGRCKSQTYRGVNEVEPSTYVTFEANGPPTNVVNSHEGPVYTTNVVEKSCSPQWNKRFEVLLPVDLMLNDEKRFILKVWRKASTDIPQARLLPNPIEDVVIGFTAIDLSVFLAGMPSISGWYNIVDFAGRINGQIKVHIQPMEDIQIYREDTYSHIKPSAENAINPAIQNAMLPLTIDVGSDMNSSVLGRTLKRKFTELEEITQRLKARLFDVTGDAAVDPDDEFENDLNTNPEEDECEHNMQPETATNNFDWLRMENTNNATFEGQASEFQHNMAATSAFESDNTKELYTQITEPERNITGCSQRIQPEFSFNWGNILKQHDVDTIINPNIITKLINPLQLESSEENTPRFQLPDELDVSSDSSSSEQDRIRLISKALQKANITDSTADQKSLRETPEGDSSSAKEK